MTLKAKAFLEKFFVGGIGLFVVAYGIYLTQERRPEVPAKIAGNTDAGNQCRLPEIAGKNTSVTNTNATLFVSCGGFLE